MPEPEQTPPVQDRYSPLLQQSALTDIDAAYLVASMVRAMFDET